MADNIRDEGRGPLGSIADRVVSKELSKIWSVLEQTRGYGGGTGVKAVTVDEFERRTREIYGRLDDLTKANKQDGSSRGGSFTSVGGPSSTSAGSALDVRPLDNLWSGNNLWAVDNTPTSKTEWDPATATMHFVRNDWLPAKVGIYEIGSVFIDTTYEGANATSIVPIHMHATSKNNHVGNAWGFATEAYNDADKLGKYSPTQLIGAEVSIINKTWDSRAARHCGMLVVFKNRMDVDNVPQHGKPPALESYNRGAFGIYIDTGAGRTGSASGPGGDPTIQCGWYRGIYFSPHSLDRADGNIWTYDNGKAVGIDMGDLEGAAPEGGHFYDRLNAAIALPPNTGISWDGSAKAVQTLMNNATGNFEFKVGASANAAINFSTGAFYQGPGLGYWLNLGYDGNNVFNLFSDKKIAGGVITGFTYNGMLKILIDANQFYIPFYKKP